MEITVSKDVQQRLDKINWDNLKDKWKRRACETLYSGRLKTRDIFFNLTHIKSWPMGSKLERLYFLLFRAFIFLILSPKSSI